MECALQRWSHESFFDGRCALTNPGTRKTPPRVKVANGGARRDFEDTNGGRFIGSFELVVEFPECGGHRTIPQRWLSATARRNAFTPARALVGEGEIMTQRGYAKARGWDATLPENPRGAMIDDRTAVTLSRSRTPRCGGRRPALPRAVHDGVEGLASSGGGVGAQVRRLSRHRLSNARGISRGGSAEGRRGGGARGCRGRMMESLCSTISSPPARAAAGPSGPLP